MLVRYEAPMEDVVLPPGPDVVMAWTLAAPSEASKLLLATRAAESLGATGDLTLARHCPRCGSGGHGRPHFAGRHDLAVSLASAEGVTAAAVTRGAPVGVDIEHLDDARFAGIGDVLLHPDEHAAGAAELARTWVRKESLLKALGVGLAPTPGGPPEPGHRAAQLLAPLPDGRDSGVWIADLALVPLLIGSVAVLSPQCPQVRTTEVAPEDPALMSHACDERLDVRIDALAEVLDEHLGRHRAVRVLGRPRRSRSKNDVVAQGEPQRVQGQRAALVDPVVEHQVRARGRRGRGPGRGRRAASSGRTARSWAASRPPDSSDHSHSA